MSTPAPLIVPVQVDALLVNKRVRDNETFRRWYPDFERLDQRRQPEPDPFSSASSDKPAHGVHVQWQLPDALRHGQQDGPAGQILFPHVPNRWLIVRYSRPSDRPEAHPDATGWVVDSDYLNDDDGTSAFLDPWAEGLEPAWIGRAQNIDDSPFDGRPSERPFLTAVGPGLPTFSAFQPYNENVFSLHDPLTDLPGPLLLSYAVIGWYSAPDWDILHAPPGGDVRALLESLRWSTTDPAAAPTRSYYTGTTLHLPWDLNGPRPAPDGKPDIRDVDVAVGHIAADAETALHPAAIADPEAALLWEAFGYDLLDVLDEDGESALDQALRRTWFGAAEGGYRWRIVDRPAPAGEAPRRQRGDREIARERDWLATLNATQARHDAALRQLAHAQRRLYGLWWLRGRTQRPAGWDARCDIELDPDHSGSLAEEVKDTFAAVFDPGGLRSRIPWGDTATELAAAVAEYAHRQELDPDRELQRCAEPAFHSTPDPSVIVRGAGLDRPLTDEDTLPCRTVGETVTGIVLGGEMTGPPTEPPAPVLTGLPAPELLTTLLGEFFLLDRAAATPGAEPDDTALDDALRTPHTHVRGTLAPWTRPWAQPWSPLHLIWKMNCHSTPYRSEGQDNWSFDGTRYRWQGTGAAPAPGTLTGRAMLNPLPGFKTRARLAQHAQTHPGGPVDELLTLRAKAEEWDLLSQRIEGVNTWLAQHSPAFNLSTGLIDNRRSRVPLSEVPDPGPLTGPDREFQPVRAGQLAFEQLHVIDRFGRSLTVISPDNVAQYPVLRADSVTPDIPVNPENPYRFVELPPRLIQPARLRFDYVSALDDELRIDADDGPEAAAGQTPVCGWLLANRLTHSLLVHAPDGTALGEIRTVLDTGHRRISDWDPLPGSPYPELDPATPPGQDFARELPHLHGFVTGLLDGGPDAFDELLAAVDGALCASAPGGDDNSLAALVGRPMALLRSRVRFELDGPAMTASTWDEVIEPLDPEFTDYLWNVRLGAGDILSDGLAGFFVDRDYTRLHTIAEPEPERAAPGYTVPINGREIALPARPVREPEPSRTRPATPPSAESADTAWLTLLADPWAAVHAVSDILPVGRLLLPQTWVRGPLSRIKLSFRMGPLLAPVRAVPGEEGAQPVHHLVTPGPSSSRGDWAWAEAASPRAPRADTPAAPDAARRSDGGPTDWTVLPLTPPDPVLALSDATPAARFGFLQLSGALDEPEDGGTSRRERGSGA